jgi:hypothetical protein
MLCEEEKEEGRNKKGLKVECYVWEKWFNEIP